MRKVIMLSLSLVLWAHTAFAQTQTDTTKATPTMDTAAAPAAVASPPANTVAAPATAAPTQTEQVKKVSIYLGGGIALPMSPSVFSDYWNMGFNLGVGLGYDFTPSLAFVGQIDYNNFALNGDALLVDLGLSGYGIGISGGSATMVTISGNLKANLIATPNSVSPYFLGGLGYSTLSFSDLTVSGGGQSISGSPPSESAFSILFGAGIDIPASKSLDVFFEGKYGIVLTEDESTNYLPLRAGIKVKL